MKHGGVGLLNLPPITYPGFYIDPYLSVYCVYPPDDDGCPLGVCPNPDIAGPLVRAASELIQALGDFEPHY